MLPTRPCLPLQRIAPAVPCLPRAPAWAVDNSARAMVVTGKRPATLGATLGF